MFPFFRAENEGLGRCWEISEASPAPFGRPRAKTVSKERPAEQFRSEGVGVQKTRAGNHYSCFFSNEETFQALDPNDN